MLLFILVAVLTVGANCFDPIVKIPQGILKGRTRINRDGGSFYSFQNIPYGRPPVGQYRFKAPREAGRWLGIRDATKDLPQCVQRTTGEGQEDCLYLNVYTQELGAKTVAKKPVMVYIHGGSFAYGSAQDSLYGPEFLLTKDVVLVVINYRLGMFGFMSLDDPNLGVPGNAGLKDQVLALKWVQRNIGYFGGDPKNVLIFGQSGGALSVHLHMLSPVSKGLFHKAIAESNCALCAFEYQGVRNSAVILAEQLGIQTDNWSKMLAALLKVPAKELSSADLAVSSNYSFISLPIVEVASSESPFWSGDPLDIIRSGKYNQVPYINGITDAEAIKQVQVMSLFITDFAQWIPADLQIEEGSPEEAEIKARIRAFYYGGVEPSEHDISTAVELVTDQFFGFPVYRCTFEHLKTATQPMYHYIFSADTRLNFNKLMEPSAADFPGAAHEDELGYLFHNTWTPSEIEPGSVEDLGIRNMVDLWTNFARYSNPTPSNFSYQWTPARQDQFNYLHIDTNISTTKVDPRKESYEFWSQLYEEYFPRS